MFKKIFGTKESEETIEFKACLKRSHQGDIASQFNLGMMYANGQGVAKDDTQAIAWYRKAAEQGDATAQCALGWMYGNGRGVAKDDTQAVAWYRKADEQGKGNRMAQSSLGFMYTNGRGVTKDEAQAMAARYRKAAEQGHVEAQFHLGLMYYNDQCVLQTVAKDDAQAVVAWFRRGAEQGVAKAQFNLARMYEDGEGVAKDDTQALAWYRKAAEQGDADAQNNLGAMYANGQGVAKDDRQAVAWYRKAAEQGLADAQTNLGLIYANGRGVAKDEVQAVSWYRKAAEQGLAKAQCALGVMYDNGQGVEKDHTQAIAWYRKAAEQGDADAQLTMGWIYEHGRGLPFAKGTVEQDDRQAVAWYRKAAEQGLARAQYRLGWMYEDGEGVAQDDTQAIAWYRKAAEQGFARAQYSLGVMYQNGQGVAKDDTQAIAWYRKAAEQGTADAQAALKRLGVHQIAPTPAALPQASAMASVPAMPALPLSRKNSDTDFTQRISDELNRRLPQRRSLSDEELESLLDIKVPTVAAQVARSVTPPLTAVATVQQAFNPFNPPEITAASPRLSRKNSEINLTQLRDELTILKQQSRQGEALIQVHQKLPALIQTLSEQHLQNTLSFLAQNQAGTQHAVALGQADLERQTALRQIESTPPLQDYYASFQWYIYQSFQACTVISSEKVEGQYEEDWTDKCLGFASDHSDIVPIPGVKLVVNALISAGQHVKQARKLNAVKRIAQLKMWATPLAIEPLFEAIARKLVLHPHKQHFIKMECSKITSPREGIVGFFIKAKGKIQGYYDDITQALDQSTAAQLAQKDVEALLAHIIETQQVELPRAEALVEHFVSVILDALKKQLTLPIQAPASSSTSPVVSKRIPPPVPQKPILKSSFPSGSVSAPPVLQTAPAPTMEQFLAMQKQMETMMKAQQEAQFKADQAAATIAKLQKKLGDSDTTVSGGSQAQMQVSRSANAFGQGHGASPLTVQIEYDQRLRELERRAAEDEERRRFFEKQLKK